MDWVGSWSLAGAVTAAMLVLSIGPIAGWTSIGVVIAGVAALALGILFVWRESTFATPLVPTTYWRRRNFMFPMGAKGFSSFAYFGGFFLFPLLMEQVYGYSVSQVGFLSVARPLVFAISAPIAGYMTVRTGERNATLFGTGALLLSMILFATLTVSSGLVVVLIALALSGLGMGVSMPATSATMSNELAESEYGVMSAAQLLASQVGEVAGIQVVLTIQESLARHVTPDHGGSVLHSFSVPFWVGAGAAALSVVCALFIRPMTPARPGAAQTKLATPRDVAQACGHLRRVGVGGARRRLQCHELGHVALDAHLAGHEGLHAGLGVALDEDRLGRVVVDRDLEVLLVQVPGVQDELTARRVHVRQDVVLGEGHVGHHEVHAHLVGDRRRLALVLGADLAGLIQPFVAEERVRRHVRLLLRCRSCCWCGTSSFRPRAVRPPEPYSAHR